MICKLFVTRCAKAIANVVSIRAKEAVEKLTGDKVTAKRMQPMSKILLILS